MIGAAVTEYRSEQYYIIFMFNIGFDATLRGFHASTRIITQIRDARPLGLNGPGHRPMMATSQRQATARQARCRPSLYGFIG